LKADTPNFTATSGGSHPKVKGNGYVPYYMVFDRHGKLVREHMCGAYHGGDGLAMIDWVTKLLKETPPIYLGREPFKSVADLAERIAWKKKFPAPIRELELRLEEGAAGAEGWELKRLHKVVEAWVDTSLKRAIGPLYQTQPSQVVPFLTGLSKELKRTQLGRKVDSYLKDAKNAPNLKDSIAIEKVFVKARAKYEKADARTRRAAAASARKKLAKVTDGKDELPITRTVKAWLAELP